MSELKAYDLVDIQDYRGEVYLKFEADKVIAELKDKLRHYPMMVTLLESDKKEIAELKQKLENVQASMYCDVVDANMENRRLKRALYLILAYLHSSKGYEYLTKAHACELQSGSGRKYMYLYDRKVYCEKRCQAKAEEYK